MCVLYIYTIFSRFKDFIILLYAQWKIVLTNSEIVSYTVNNRHKERRQMKNWKIKIPQWFYLTLISKSCWNIAYKLQKLWQISVLKFRREVNKYVTKPVWIPTCILMSVTGSQWLWTHEDVRQRTWCGDSWTGSTWHVSDPLSAKDTTWSPSRGSSKGRLVGHNKSFSM